MENNKFGLDVLTNSLEGLITNVPAPVRKNFIKAFGQLCTAAVDIPLAWLEGKSSEIRATTEARIQIIKKEGDSIAEKIEPPKEYISKAASKFAAKIIKEQINLDEITLNAANELINNKQVSENTTEEVVDISEDWLNEFENIARFKSSEDMKFVFGKILSGEIIKPGSFSMRTVKLISQLDNQAARLFQLLCNQTVSLNIGNRIWDARVVSLNGNAGSNSLSQFGLSFDNLNILQEYGLVISDYNSNMEYSHSIANEYNQVMMPISFQNKSYGLVPTNRENYDKNLKLSGVALTKAGKELLSIIPFQATDAYKTELIAYFKTQNLDFVELQYQE